MISTVYFPFSSAWVLSPCQGTFNPQVWRRGEASCSLLSVLPGSLISLSPLSIHPELCFGSVFLNLCGMRENFQNQPLCKNDKNFSINVPSNLYLKFPFPLDCQKHRDFSVISVLNSIRRPEFCLTAPTFIMLHLTPEPLRSAANTLKPGPMWPMWNSGMLMGASSWDADFTSAWGGKTFFH